MKLGDILANATLEHKSCNDLEMYARELNVPFDEIKDSAQFTTYWLVRWFNGGGYEGLTALYHHDKLVAITSIGYESSYTEWASPDAANLVRKALERLAILEAPEDTLKFIDFNEEMPDTFAQCAGRSIVDMNLVYRRNVYPVLAMNSRETTLDIGGELVVSTAEVSIPYLSDIYR